MKVLVIVFVISLMLLAIVITTSATDCRDGLGRNCTEAAPNPPASLSQFLWVSSGRDTGAMAGTQWINDLETVSFDAPTGKLFTSVSIEFECQGPATRLHDVQVYYYVSSGVLCEQQLIEPPFYAAKPHGLPGANSYILDTIPSDVTCAAGFRRIEIEPQIGSACRIVNTQDFRTASIP